MPANGNRGAVPAIIILTYNEEANIAHCLDSVKGWANEIYILDSFSADRTLEIARGYGCRIRQNKFENYAKQRNFALDDLSIESEWILFLDADELMTVEGKEEISKRLAEGPAENGFYLNRRFIWMGRWIRRGYYPTWILRLFRRGKGRCEDRAVNEHIVVEGTTARLRCDFIHQDRKPISDWIEKHNGYAGREAAELVKANAPADEVCREIHVSLFGSQEERKRWLRLRVWNRLPPLIRPLLYFFYRYVIAGGFLDGREAFIYHFLQALWYPMLIDIKYLELKLQ